MRQEIEINPLSEKTLAQIIELVHSIFPDDAAKPDDSPGLAFKASLEKEKFKHLYDRDKLKYLRYFVVLDGMKVIGTTGLYAHTNEPNDVVWLGWFCIDPKYRGRGIGKSVLQWTINKAKEEKYSVLRLYTSDELEYCAAQILYRKMGFVRTDTRQRNNEPEVIFELQLKGEASVKKI